MTDYELDQVIQRILIDAQKADEEQMAGEDIPFNPSVRYQRNMRALCKDPRKWLRNRECPVWKSTLRRIAIILLAVSIGFGGVMVSVPSVRAAVIQWVIEWYETYIVYRHSGGEISSVSSEFEITALPEGFSEITRNSLRNITGVTYEDTAGNVICFEYCNIHQGSAASFETENATVVDITVNGMVGQFFETESSEEFNTLTWVDERNNIQFSISGCFDKEDLLHMATNVHQE